MTEVKEPAAAGQRDSVIIGLKLTEREARILLDTLRQALSGLHTEIQRTDVREYRRMLQERREVLETIVERLAPERASKA